jgi:hypothetical protein
MEPRRLRCDLPRRLIWWLLRDRSKPRGPGVLIILVLGTWGRGTPTTIPDGDASGGTGLFQAIGAFLDALLLIGVGIAGRYYAPRWVRKDGSPQEVERRFARTRQLGAVLLVLGLGTLTFRLLSL